MSDVCPDCGSPLTSSTRYGWGTYRTYKCGKVVDDGPGRSCPHAEASWRAYNLTKFGDPCDWQEAETLTEDQYAHRLLVAQQAQREREERARIEAEEKAERERLEAEEKARREAEEAKRRAELEAENERLIAAMKAQEAEVARLHAEARELAESNTHSRLSAEREAREREERAEAARQEALRPERERIAAWARQVLETMPSTPAIQDADLLRRMRITVETVRDLLIDLEQEMQ